MRYDAAFAELTEVRGYGPCSARGVLHAAQVRGSYVDEFPARADGSRPAVQVCALNDAGTEFSIRSVTVRPLSDPAPDLAARPAIRQAAYDAIWAAPNLTRDEKQAAARALAAGSSWTA